MKKILLWGIFVLSSSSFCFAQNPTYQKFFNQNVQRKGKFYMYWGYNRGQYTHSNLTLKGDDYDFTLKHIKAVDKPEPFDWKVYFSPAGLSIPQYNYGIGYYLTNKLSLSFNVDHMKYVMVQNQTVAIEGDINEVGNPFDRHYEGENIKITEDFLTFEHTDGLNYLNFELSRTSEIFGTRNRKFVIEAMSGVAVGVIMPKSNVKLFNYPRNDHFHFAGFGLSSRLALNFIFFEKVFLQTNLKGGFIDMPDIVTRKASIADRAKQDFWFLQENAVLGVFFKLNKKKAKETSPK
jgi:hypothetical protein